MTNQAKITSTEALESFRAHLVVFLAKARRCVDDSAEEIRRTRQWLQYDARAHWEGEFRRKTKQLEQAKQELMSARLGAESQQSAVMARQMAVAKLQREIAEAEGKLRKLKGWGQNFDTCADPIMKRMDRLRQSLDELPKAIAYLVAIQRALDAYTESSRPVTASAPETSSSTESAPGEQAGTESPTS